MIAGFDCNSNSGSDFGSGGDFGFDAVVAGPGTVGMTFATGAVSEQMEDERAAAVVSKDQSELHLLVQLVELWPQNDRKS